MDEQNLMTQMEQDFLNLAEEHEGTAKNEHLWSLGAEDPEVAAMHEQNAEEHRALAEAYRRMSGHVLGFVETYFDDYAD